MDKKSIITLIAAPLVCILIGFFATSTLTNNNYEWYNSLKLSPLNPPNFVFGIAWGFLYILIGLSLAFLLITNTNSDPIIQKYKTISLILFATQFIINILWTYMFFGLKNPLLGVIVILILDIVVIISIFFFYKVSKSSGTLFLPYLAWILFASNLNIYILIFN